MLITIIIFVAVLSLLVFVHELGHFLVARKLGIAVEEFGFGFPPRIYGTRFGRRGGTLYSVNWIPLGGFVRIKGEAGEHAADKDSFAAKSLPRRALVLVAGVLMNVLLAWALFTVGFAVGFPQVVEDLSPHARVGATSVQVSSVLPDSAAAAADVRLGDTFVAYDGHAVEDTDAFRERTKEGRPVEVTLRRGGEELTKTLVPTLIPGHPDPVVGLSLARTGLVSYPLWYAPIEGGRATVLLTGQVLSGFGEVITSLVRGQKAGIEFSGPVGIAVLTGEAARLGFRHLLQFTALLSLNLAVVNLFPFPALDGGRLLFIVVERLRGRAFGKRIETYVHGIGFLILIGLVLLVTARDFAKYGGGIWSAIRSLFS
jgi:regulator of sigma E protease